MRQRKTGIRPGLVGDRKLVGTDYLARAEFRREYEAEIAPRTEEALRRILQRVSFEPGWPRRVLDLGAGTGAAGRAIRAHCAVAWGAGEPCSPRTIAEGHGEAGRDATGQGGRVCGAEVPAGENPPRVPISADLELVAVDKVPSPGIVVADVARAERPAGVSGRFDLVLAAHLLNELNQRLDLDAQARLVAGWCRDLLEPDGMCIVIEPALRDTSRALLGVRDRLCAAGLHVAAPCFFRAACPALQRERDWCHDSAGVLVAGRSRVDFSYLVLLRSATVEPDPRRYRVVSDPLKDKGRIRFFVCGATGRHQLMRLDRDRQPANQALDQARRGDVLVLPNAVVRDDGIRIAANAAVAIDSAPVRR